MVKLGCVLLIDDNFNDLFYHSVIIREAGLVGEVKTARNGRKALEYLEMASRVPDQPFPELIFLDLQMPDLNGFEFLKALNGGHICLPEKKPVVMILTNSLSLEIERTAKEQFFAEIMGFFNKPLTTGMLEHIIRNCF